MNLKIFFTWWNKQTFGTFLKTLFLENTLALTILEISTIKKKDERWVIYSSNIEATKITSEWFMWMHHTVDKIPQDNEKICLAKKSC